MQTTSKHEDQGLGQTALERPTDLLHYISVMKNAIQAMEKHHSEMQEAYSSMSHQCANV